MRAFLAIPVLPPALSVVQALRERLLHEVPAVRWGPADSLHITLHFFGALSGADAERALDAVRPVIAGRAPLLLRLDGLGSFPSARDPHVVWCGVDGDVDGLVALAADCRTTLRSVGFPVDDRRFCPHCTLGRPRRPWGAEARQRWSDLALEGHVTPAFGADCVVLFESVAGRDGVRHVPRATASLGVATARVVSQPAQA
jgi:RNA 2',3'-cyclic 3'-phosphodiesterase